MSGTRGRSSVTGQFVPRDGVAADPEHTVLETIVDMRLLECPEPGCDARLGSERGGRLEHHSDGSHTWYPDGDE